MKYVGSTGQNTHIICISTKELKALAITAGDSRLDNLKSGDEIPIDPVIMAIVNSAWGSESLNGFAGVVAEIGIAMKEHIESGK